MRDNIRQNRDAFLLALRTGDYKKGTIKSDDRGYPLFETEADKIGFCACAIMTHMFGEADDGRLSVPKASKALGLPSSACGYIQREINDTELTFPQMADRIEREVFR